YHIHTPRCGDAEGDYEEYVQEAVEKGIAEVGFSGHSPQYFLPEKERKRESAIPEEELSLYVQEVEKLREKYRGMITIRIGLEVDFIPDKEKAMRAITDFYSWDYLLLSVHYLNGWPFDHPKYIGRYQEEDINKVYRRYYQILKMGVETGIFDVVAHFDLPKKFGFLATETIEEIEDVLQSCREHDMVLEINTAGFYKPIGEAYPSFAILERASKLGLQLCLGSDAHRPCEVGRSFDVALRLARDTGFQSLVSFEKRRRTAHPL
ncbi:MAG: histidinol-phosphatase HisJ, partial [Atribacterota bacterium]|nr:histidinol-phosphatase HisJ [Atribacterota bacterium]